MRRLRTYFFAGLIVCAPIGITIWLTWTFISFFDSWVKPYVPAVYNPDTYLPFSVPGVGLIFTIVAITIVGALAANLVGKTMLGYWETLLGRMPVVRSIYRGTKQIFETALSQSNSNFQLVGLVEYPRKGVRVVTFIGRELESGDIGMEPGTQMYACFMPTTPNPTSGFLFFIDKEQVQILDIPVEDAAKLVISAGLVLPGQERGLDELILDEETFREIADAAPVMHTNKKRKKSRVNQP